MPALVALPGAARRAMAARARTIAARARTMSPFAADVAIAAGCYVAAGTSPLRDDAPWWVFGLVALASLPLVWRRRWPIIVSLLTGAGTVALSLADHIHELPFGQLVATYTWASLSPAGWRIGAALLTAVGVTVSTALPSKSFANTWVAALPFVAAYALGMGNRARRDRIAMLEEREHRLAKEHQAAAAVEREQIARDMHDILAHSISLIVVQAEAGPVVVRTDPDRAAAAFDTIADAGRDAMAQLRRTLGVLRSDGASRTPQPDLGGLGALVAQARTAGLKATVDEYGDRRAVPPEVGVAAYRIVQEAITNTLRHAGASTIRIRLSWSENGLDLDVCDDGRGPTPAASGSGSGLAPSVGPGLPSYPGHGLIGMRERVAGCGGTLHIGTGDSGGFRVSATFPLASR